MSTHKARSKSSLFLMELILVILFFSISAAICMKVFATAKVKTDFSRNVSNATFAAETIAETFKDCDGNLIELAEKFDGEASGTTLIVYYDNEWNSCKKGNESFVMTVNKTTEEYLQKAEIDINTASGEDLFELVVADANTD